MATLKTTGRGSALYLTLPQDVAFDSRHHDFDPFELAILGGILTAARFLLGDKNNRDAFAYAGRTIRRQLKKYDEHKIAWEKTHLLRKHGIAAKAPTVDRIFRSPTHKIDDRSKDLKRLGTIAYRKLKSKRRKQPPPDRILLTISRSRLLIIAGVSRDGGNLARLDRCLARLQRGMAIAGRKLPALLNPIQIDSSGKLMLDVCGDWLAFPYRQIPLPLPIKSRTATYLYMFLQCIWTRPADREHIGFKALCERIGIDTAQPPSRAGRAVQRALDIINDHMLALDADALASHKINVPDGYEIKSVSEYNIRFVGVPRAPTRRSPILRIRADKIESDETDTHELGTRRKKSREEIRSELRQRMRAE